MEQVQKNPARIFRLGAQQEVRPADFPLGLGEAGVHEICEAEFGDMAALTGFALASAKLRRGAIAWIRQRPIALDHGRLLQAGLGSLRAAAPPVFLIDARKPEDALWATEEAIRSSAVGLVVTEVRDLDFTASRRLTLAASRHGVPAILLMPYTREGSTAAQARWRVSARPSAPNRLDPHAPGNARWQATLERSRRAPHMAGQVFNIELKNETLSLTVVSGLGADAAEAPVAGDAPPQVHSSIRQRA